MGRKKEKDSRSPDSMKKYNKKYYKDNKQELTDKKKSRYASDPEYREKCKARAKQQREENKKNKVGTTREYNGKTVQVTKIGAAAKALEITTFQIIDWESKGLLPKSVFGKTRAYTEQQMQLIASARDGVKRTGSIVTAVLEVGGTVQKGWLGGL